MDIQALAHASGFGAEGLHLADRPSGGQPSAARGEVTVRALATDPDLLSDLVDQYLDMHEGMFGPTARRDISALWLLQDVSWLHAVLAVGLLPAHRISLRPSDDDVWLQLPRDMAFAVSVPSATVPVEVATTAAEAGALYSSARGYLADVLGGFVEALRPHLRTGPHAAWACVTDMASGAISTGATRFGGADRVRSELAPFLAAGQPGPLLTGLRMTSSPTGPLRVRKGCCLLYAIDGMQVCFSCPRLIKPG